MFQYRNQHRLTATNWKNSWKRDCVKCVAEKTPAWCLCHVDIWYAARSVENVPLDALCAVWASVKKSIHLFHKMHKSTIKKIFLLQMRWYVSISPKMIFIYCCLRSIDTEFVNQIWCFVGRRIKKSFTIAAFFCTFYLCFCNSKLVIFKFYYTFYI